MSKKYDFEYMIIGSGPAGSTAAINLAKSKKRIALVENRFFGGSNINTRDIPYDVALNFSGLYDRALHSPELQNQDLSFSLPSIISHELKVTLTCNSQNKKAYEKAGIVRLEGCANFLDNHTIAIDGKQFTSRVFILATGARLKTTEIAGLETVKCLTPETAIKVRRKPKAILIVGGGSTGCEIATYFAELGSKVLIMETAERILPREDKEVGDFIANYLSKHLGVMVLPNCKVVAIEQDGTSKRAIFRTARTEKMVRIDCVALATGSEPILDYGLENAGVKYKNAGILTNKFFETSAKNIYAIGDARGKDSSTELAEYEGSVLASNLSGRSKTTVNYNGFIRVTKTHPEIAVVGLNEDDLTRRDRKCKKAIVSLSELPVSAIDHHSIGFVKLLADRNCHIVGGTIVAPNAGLIAEELSIAIRHNLTALELASTPHLVNSANYAIKTAARKLVVKK